ncbi:MAG: tRNA 5-methylaminomethyl-2-thiouridine biosynthesis bifunctional protein [Dinoroseobacter sp.]
MKSPDTYLLPYARVSWQASDAPFAQDYDDVYWSSEGGLAEKQHVFISSCQLESRWEELTPGNRFTILETGFGFGLNFLLTLQAWHSKPRPPNTRLDYFAFEKHLVNPHDLMKMAASFSLDAELKLFIDQYPMPVPGNHTLWLDDSICLHLMIGDIHDQIHDLDGKVDAVFLDGFSPDRNEDMWGDDLVQKLAQRLRPGARVATYSAAGALRRRLTSYGLVTKKLTGFGKKRHMLMAEQAGEWEPDKAKKQTIVIVGAGLSGLLCATALIKRGHQVTVIDQHAEPLGALRQIHQIAIYPKLSKSPQPYSNFYLRAYLYYLRHCPLNACGRIELLDTEEKCLYAAALVEQMPGFLELIDASTASARLSIKVDHPALVMSGAGWIKPNQLAGEQAVLRSKVTALSYAQGSWNIETSEGSKLTATTVILATGNESLSQLAPLELMSLRGQSLRLHSSEIGPKAVLSRDKTWFPIADGESTVSATYDRFDDDLSIRLQDTQSLLGSLDPYLPELLLEATDNTGGVGIRSATRDRMPVVDQLPDWQKLELYCQLPPIQRTGFDGHAPGLYCAVGFGSHGGTLGPYCAELLARNISGDPVGEDLQQISSSRFKFRDAGIKLRQKLER